jgi:hypothetical protein
MSREARCLGWWERRGGKEEGPGFREEKASSSGQKDLGRGDFLRLGGRESGEQSGFGILAFSSGLGKTRTQTHATDPRDKDRAKIERR